MTDIPGAVNRAIDTADRHPWSEFAFGAVVAAVVLVAWIRRSF